MPVDEVVALVDRSGRVVGSRGRRVVRRDNLLHAATAVLVRNPARAIYVHRRSAEKDWAPGHHDCAAGGMLRFGETPLLSALRELDEELGISAAPLHPLGTSLYEDGTTRCFEYCFEVSWPGAIVHRDAEVAWGAWTSLAELDRRLCDPSWPFVPDTRQLLARLARDGVGDYAALESLRRASTGGA